MERATGTLTWEQQYAERRGLRHWPNEETLRFLGRHKADGSLPDGSSILEIGCGNGANLWALSSEGYRVTGIDVSQTALDLAAEQIEARGVPTVCLEQASITEWPTWIRGHAAVLDVVTMQHIPLPAHDAVYQHIYDALNPDGWFFSYHLGSRTWDFGKGTMIGPYSFDNISDPNAIFPNNGVVCMPPVDELVTRLASVGFDVTRTETVTKTYGEATKCAEYHVIEATRR